MKTKFSSILKIKKLETEKLQNEIIKLQNQKKQRQSELEILIEELKKLQPPKNGTVYELQKSFVKSSIQKDMIDLKRQNILFLEEQVKLTELKYKEAMLEYEKIKHLDEIEVKKKLDMIKRLEAKELDEIGTLLFSRKSDK